jgi:large subunit ribosomal protein L10
MAITRLQKEEILGYLGDNVATQKAVVILTTKDTAATLTAMENTKFRKVCYSKGVSLQVVKNSLIQKTFPSVSGLTGQTYVAYLTEGANSDEVTVTKAVVDQVTTDFKANFDIIGTVVNGEFYDKEKSKQLANVPTFEQSMAQLAGTLNQITAKIAIAIKEIPASVGRGIKAAKEVA